MCLSVSHRPHMEDNFSFKFDTLNGECLLNGRKLENLKRSNNLTHNFEIISVFDGHGGSVGRCLFICFFYEIHIVNQTHALH